MWTSSETYLPPRTFLGRLFRRDAETKTRDACATRKKMGTPFGKTPDGARRIRALPAVARSDIGKFFPAQTQPVVPGLSHAIARSEIALVELVAFEELRESGFHRQLFTVKDGIGGSDCG